MSLFDQIASWFKTPEGRTPSHSRRVYVVDPAGMSRDKKGRDRLPPGAQVKILQRLSRFAKKESLDLSAVFEGKALRAVEHEGDFQGIKVYFASPQGSAYAEMVMSIVRRGLRSAQVTGITDDPKLAASIEAAGGQAMRYATFRKALDAGGGKNGEGSGNRPKRSNRRGRSRPPAGESRESRESREAKPQKPAPERDPVSDLIDLID